MSRSHHSAYSQQQHHHTHQNSWFMSPNIVNSLFCSPGNNSSGNFNNAFLNSSNINNHLTNLLNAQHHFMPRNQLSNSQSHSNTSQSVIGGNTFSSHYQGNHQSFTSQPYSSIFSLNNAYSNSNTGSSNRFIAGQNNHHYQNSSNYARSMHSNRMSRGNIDFNSIIPEQNHPRRYQSGMNPNGPLISYPGSVANSKSMNINCDFNAYNDNSNSTRSTSSNFSFYQNKESKSLNNNNNFNSNMKYNTWSKLSNSETDDTKGSTSDISSNSKYGHKHQQVKGMENIKLDNEGVHSNYIQFTGMTPKQSPIVVTNYDSFSDEKQKSSTVNRRDNVDWSNNYSKLNSKHHNSKLEVFDNPKKTPISKITEPDFPINQKKGSVKFLLNVDEDELIYYDDDIVEIARFEPENKKEESSPLVGDKNYGNEITNSVANEIPKIDEKYLSTLSDSENRYECDENTKKKQRNKENSSSNNPESITSNHTFSGPCTSKSISCTNMEFSNSEGNFNAHQQHIVNSSPISSSFPNSNLISGIPPSNMFAYPSQIIPNFAMNCPLLSNPGNNMMAATYIAAALSGSHPSMVSNPNSKCNIFRHDSLAFNSNSYHDIVSSKLWQYYITNRQTEAMYVRKVQLRNALHMVMSYVFENAGLFIVGSSMNGFGNDHSDMDLCLTITSKELHQKKEAFVVLNQLVEPLRKCSFIKNLQLIRATVPILKFRDALAGVDCDLNINNVVGIYNTHLLAMYNRIDWRVRPLGMYIKHWAQKLDLHDASRGRLSTYTLILMIIQYLQAGCQPPVLPSLQAKFPKHFTYDRQVKEVDMRLELPWDELRSTNTIRLSDLLLGFFEYYVEKFDFSRMAISVRTGKPIPIEIAIKQLPPHEQLHNVKSFKMFIEEPFSLTNVARSLFDGLVFSRIKRCFRHSLQVMRMKESLKCMFSLPTPSSSIIANLPSSSENIDQTRLAINASPTTSNSTQDDNSKTVPVSDIDIDNSDRIDFKDDCSYSDDNKSIEKNVIIHYDFEEDDVIVSG